MNEDLAEQIIDGTREFWHNNVLPKIEPDLSTMEDVVSKYPTNTEAALVASEPMLELCKAHEINRQEIKEMEASQTKLKVEIGTFIGNHRELLVDENGKVLAAFTTPKPREMVSAPKLKKLSPEIYQDVSYLSEPKRTVGMRWQTLKGMVNQDES